MHRLKQWGRAIKNEKLNTVGQCCRSRAWIPDRLIPVWPKAPSPVLHQSGWEYVQLGLSCYIVLGLPDISFSPTSINFSDLSIPWYFSLTFLFNGAKQAPMSLPHFMITTRILWNPYYLNVFFFESVRWVKNLIYGCPLFCKGASGCWRERYIHMVCSTYKAHFSHR